MCDELCKGFPLISRISSATSRSALSAGDPETFIIKISKQTRMGKAHWVGKFILIKGKQAVAELSQTLVQLEFS